MSEKVVDEQTIRADQDFKTRKEVLNDLRDVAHKWDDNTLHWAVDLLKRKYNIE